MLRAKALALLLLSGVWLQTGAVTAAAQNVSCTCRYQGQDYGIGESICLKGSNGMRMATCAMVLNNTSWKFSNAPCPLTLWEQERVLPDTEWNGEEQLKPQLSRRDLSRPS